MRSERSIRRIARTAVALTILAGGVAGAETPRGIREQLAEFRRTAVAQRASRSTPHAPEWGLDAAEVLNVNAYDFQANTSSDVINDDGNGYRYFGAPGVPYMAAPVQLPAGAHVTTLRLSHCSANAGDLVVALYDNGIEGDGSGGGTLVAGPLVTGVAGCAAEVVGADYLHVYEYSHPLYLVVWFAGNNFDATTKFNNVALSWQREVSPAPSTASFGDVPTTDFGFQFVEALAASGITGGCSGGNYCPDSPVTRRQMAIFLAKALGLNWDN